MKSKLVFTLLLVTMFLFPGCYIILLVEPTDEDLSFNPDPPPYDPGPLPIPAPPPDPCPCPFPPPPSPSPQPVIVIIHPTPTQPSTIDRRPIHTERGPFVSNPAPIRTNENNRPTRDSGVQRGGYADSNPAPARNDENNRPTRDSGVQRGGR